MCRLFDIRCQHGRCLNVFITAESTVAVLIGQPGVLHNHTPDVRLEFTQGMMVFIDSLTGKAHKALSASNSSFVSPFLAAKSHSGAIAGFVDVVVSGRRSDPAAFFHGCNKDDVGVGVVGIFNEECLYATCPPVLWEREYYSQASFGGTHNLVMSLLIFANRTQLVLCKCISINNSNCEYLNS